MFGQHSNSPPSANTDSCPREAPLRPEPLTTTRPTARLRVPRKQDVADIRLDAATDREVWEHARDHDRDHDLVIVSKDPDFRQLAFFYGAPPKVVWLRVGKITTDQIAEYLRRNARAIDRFSAIGDEALLVIEPTRPSGTDV